MNAERPELWFGAWPPDIRREELAMPEQTVKLPKIFWIVLGVAALSLVVSLLVLFQEHTRGQEGSWYGFYLWALETLVAGFVTALVLATTVDMYLKKKIVEEVFKAAVGYLLPPALREEMKWIHDIPFLSQGQHQEFVISPVPDEPNLVRITEHSKINLRNITNGTTPFDPRRTVQTSICGPSDIVHYQATYGSVRRTTADGSLNRTSEARSVSVNGESIHA